MLRSDKRVRAERKLAARDTRGIPRSLVTLALAALCLLGPRAARAGAAPPVFTSPSNLTVDVGGGVNFAVTATGNPSPSYSLASGSLPPGLALVAGIGKAYIQGTPAAGSQGVHQVTLSASNGTPPDATQTFEITVRKRATIVSVPKPTFTVGQAGSATFQASGYPTPTVHLYGTLPTGVSFTDNGDGTGTLSGTPQPGTAGQYMVAFGARDWTGESGQYTTLTVQGSPVFTSAAAVSFATGSAGVWNITTSGSPAATMTMTGTLPAGLSFTDNGNGTARISGTPKSGSGGVYTLTFTADNGLPPAATQTFTLTVQELPNFTSSDSTTFAVGTPGSFTVTTSAYPKAALTVFGALPSGVSFTDNGNGTATIGGTPSPNSGKLYTLALTASNGLSSDGYQTFKLTVTEPPRLASSNKPQLQEGQSAILHMVFNGYPAPTLALVGNLPPGLSYKDNADGTATLTGTPQAGSSGFWPFTVKAVNAVGAFDAEMEMAVLGPPRLTSPATAQFTTGVAGSFDIVSVGAPYATITILNSLPPGLTLVDNGNGTATLAGTPQDSAAGIWSLAVLAANGRTPDAAQNVTVTVNQPPAFTNATQAAFTLGHFGQAPISVKGYPVPTIASGAVPAGLTFTPGGAGAATIGGTPTTAGTSTVTLTASNGVGSDATQSLTITVNPPLQFGLDALPAWTVDHAGYKAAPAVTGGTGSRTYRVAGGSLPPGLALDRASGLITGQPTATGSYAFSVQVTDHLGASATKAYELTVNEAITVSPEKAIDWAKDLSGYSRTISGSGGTGTLTYSLTAGALPAGLSLNASTGEISGTPTAIAYYVFTITATDSVGATASRHYDSNIVAPVGIEAATLPNWTVNQPGYLTNLASTGGLGPFSYAVSQGSLPPGLSLSTAGKLSGTPTATGTFAFTVGVTDAALGDTNAAAYQISIAPVVAITSASLPLGIHGVPYSQGIAFAGGTGSIALSVTGGALPDGLTVSDGAIRGVPTRVGSFDFVLTATDATGAASNQSYTIVVIPAGPDAAQSAAQVPATATAGTAVTISITGRDLTGASNAGHPEKFTVAVAGANAQATALTVEDLGGGRYQASYTPTRTGSDTVTVSVDGTALSGTPGTVQVSPGALAWRTCTMEAPHSVVAGNVVTCTLHGHDLHGNPAAGQASSFVVVVEGANAQSTPVTVTDLGGGRYQVSYPASRPGTDTITASINGTSIARSPVTVAVTPRPADPSRSSVELSRAIIAADGQMTATLAVTLRDANGIAVDGLEPAARSLTIDGLEADSGLTVTSAGDVSDAEGRYQVTVTADRRDTFTLTPVAGGTALTPVSLRSTAWTWLRFTEGGRHFVGLPITPLDSGATAVFGDGSQVARWVDGQSQFVGSEAGPAELFQFRPGRGLWVHLPAPLTRQVLGDAPPEGDLELPLEPGWNNAANPFDADLSWDPTRIRVLRNGQDLGALSNPQLWSVAYPYVWVYDPDKGSHHLVFGLAGGDNRVPRHAGMWTATGKAESGVSLLLPAPAPGASSRSRGPAATPRDWQMGLVANGPSGRAEVLCGSVSGLTRALNIVQPPASSRAGLELSVVDGVHRSAGSLQPASERWAWNLEVRSAADGDVTLSWPGLLRGLPRGVVVELFDPATGQQLALNTRASYRFVATAGQVRPLQLRARLGQLQRPEVTAFRVVPGRGRGVLCTISLSGGGQVGLTVRGLGGKLVRQVPPRAIESGQLTIGWDGLDNDGRPVPAGSYQVEATVIGENGTISRVSRAVVVR